MADHLAIIAQPVGAAKQAGESHTLSVAATGGFAPLTYTWKKDGGIVFEERVCVLEPLVIEDSGAYTVEIFDDNGDFVASVSVSLDVTPSLPLAAPGALVALVLAMAGLGVSVRRRQ